MLLDMAQHTDQLWGMICMMGEEDILKTGDEMPLVDGFKPELLIEHRRVILTFLFAGLMLSFVGNSENAGIRWSSIYLVTAFYLTAAIAWWLDGWQPYLARWFSVIAVIAIVFLGSMALQLPGLAFLSALPVILAAGLIRLSAATIVAGLETLLIFLMPRVFNLATDPLLDLLAGLGIWMTWGITRAIYGHLFEIADWARQSTQQATALIAQVHEHRIVQAQTLEDLAHANLQLTRLLSQSQALRQAADDARTAKAEFVANVSHELRTPLNMIIGFTQLILSSPQTYGSIPPMLLADLAVIQRNAQHLADLVDDVLDLSQVEAGKIALTKERVSFNALVDEATLAVKPLFESKGLYLKTELPEEAPIVFCDRTRIREILLNLLSNAGRFTERGGVRLRAWVECGDICVSVSDTGPGISPDALKKLFEPFQQGDSSIKRRYGGTGLGLCISKRFIELHDGKIWAESVEGVGTTVSFRFPMAPIVPGENTFVRGIIADWEYMQRTRPNRAPIIAPPHRFVVLEQADTLQRLLKRYGAGIEIAATTTVEHAIELTQHSPAHALLVNDVSVADTLRRFNSLTGLAATPVIICSIPGADQESLSPAAKVRLVKPIDADTLIAALARLGVTRGTVLIVDDEPDALQLFSRMLDARGDDYRVLLARDGAEGLAVARKYRPAAILLDLIMPNLDGFQFLEIQAHDPELQNIPVVIISARDPSQQPIMSRAIAVTQNSGIALPQLLACMSALSQILGVSDEAAAPAPLTALTG